MDWTAGFCAAWRDRADMEGSAVEVAAVEGSAALPSSLDSSREVCWTEGAESSPALPSVAAALECFFLLLPAVALRSLLVRLAASLAASFSRRASSAAASAASASRNWVALHFASSICAARARCEACAAA
jgi:hypothetical protein